MDVAFGGLVETQYDADHTDEQKPLLPAVRQEDVLQLSIRLHL
jgi:hypothetical protein